MEDYRDGYSKKNMQTENVKLVSMEEFQAKLDRMAIWLREQGINEHGSTVFTQELLEPLDTSTDGGYILNMKSCEWVLANLMNLGNINPSHLIDVPVESMYQPKFRFQLQDILKTGGKKFFLTDDASYSGTQLRKMLSSLDHALSKDQKAQITVYLAIPYVSGIAENLIDEAKFQFKIVLYPYKEDMPLKPAKPGEGGCLFALQHKIPDLLSVPKRLNRILTIAAKRLYNTRNPPYRNILISSKQMRIT